MKERVDHVKNHTMKYSPISIHRLESNNSVMRQGKATRTDLTNERDTYYVAG